MSPERGDGDGPAVSRYFQAFVLWLLSLAVCCASSDSQSSSGRISASVSEQRDCRPFSTDVLATLTLLLLVLLNPTVSRDVRPTASVPDLTSVAATSLSFLFLTPPATPLHSGAPFQCGSRTPELQFSDWSHAFPGSKSQSALWKLTVCESARSPMQVATASRRPSTEAPSPFHLSSDICVRIHGSPLRTSILSTGGARLYRSRCIFLHLRLIPWVFRLVWYLSSSAQGTG